ncbi:uncharacterized protein LOC131328467 [Rhododendron vialii]|uniref:uncharacterized protein LOC131328467 n=1 Tax=Rhododendron vialii TaxID=182163 RepID=UPI00265E98A6|nr:uncharacterized protein LOC131328467 [Rhododendron vialii]
MANSTAPREIPNILKQKDPSNTTGIKSVYSALFSNKATKLDDLTPIQYVINQLLKKDYLHQFLTNPDTNEITDIIWVYPMSLELSVNFSSVLIIDTTYKTNEYRKSLLEVVGITSTWRTYSLMFAYLSNEREETLTWALDTLKNWILQKGASLPLVFVSDRDLVLMNAIEACFPTARHIMCIWHKWQAMCDNFRQFLVVTTYLWQTWLRSYRERAESAHARLKLYLGDTMSSLHTSFDKIENMLKNQFGKIKKSFKKSMNIPRHKQLRDDIFDQVSIHAHWTTLSMHATELNEEGTPPNRTSQVVEILDGMDPRMREHIIDRFIDMADPSRSTVRPPSYKTEHRGRPAGRDEQSTRRISYSSEVSASGSRTATSRVRGKGRCGRGSGVRNTQSTIPPIPDRYIQAIAAQIGYSENDWNQVREELIEEIRQDYYLYGVIYLSYDMANQLLQLLDCFEPTASEAHWMEAMTLGVVIATRYNLVLHTFDENVFSCFTHLPLTSPPVLVEDRRKIAIAHVGNHFDHASDEAKRWADSYETRILLWYEVMGISAPEASFGGKY